MVLTFSIAVPILCRPFYYAHISALDLPARTGWSAETIRQAYDQVLDFCVFGAPFGTGELAWSESGMSHFADVRVLFRLDFIVLGRRPGGLPPAVGVEPAGEICSSTAFWAGAPASGRGRGRRRPCWCWRAWRLWTSTGPSPCSTPSFFPGKDNWIFDPATDQIILVMPQVFFRNCAILIGGVLLVCCAGLIFADLHRRRKR